MRKPSGVSAFRGLASCTDEWCRVCVVARKAEKFGNSDCDLKRTDQLEQFVKNK